VDPPRADSVDRELSKGMISRFVGFKAWCARKNEPGSVCGNWTAGGLLKGDGRGPVLQGGARVVNIDQCEEKWSSFEVKRTKKRNKYYKCVIRQNEKRGSPPTAKSKGETADISLESRDGEDRTKRGAEPEGVRVGKTTTRPRSRSEKQRYDSGTQGFRGKAKQPKKREKTNT